MSLARRPPGAADVIDLAAARIRDAALPLLVVCAIPIVPAATLAASAPLWASTARPVVVVLPLALSGTWALAACCLVLGANGLGASGSGQDPSSLRLLARAGIRLPAVVLLAVLALVEIAFFTLLAVVPGISRVGKLQAALPILLLERTGPGVALRRSRFLTQGAEFLAVRALVGGVGAAACLAVAPIGLLLAVVPLPVGGSETLADTRLLVAAILLALLVLPAVAAVQFAIFLVRREQLEALDLQLALQALDLATPHRPGALHPAARAS